MKDVLLRLRAVLTPQVLFVLSALLLLAAGMTAREGQSASALERRIAAALSAVEGAGDVRVVIRTKKEQGDGRYGALSAQEIPVGAVAVARGADDPLVRLALEETLCTLLGLPASAVSIAAGGD